LLDPVARGLWLAAMRTCAISPFDGYSVLMAVEIRVFLAIDAGCTGI
jgi:hypothetical protein